MSALRGLVQDGGLTRAARAGDNLLASLLLTSIATDAAQTLTAEQMAGGLVAFTGFTAGRTVTTDTAANILAANPSMDIGDSFLLGVSISPAFAATWAAGASVTLAGKATTPASGFTWILVTKTSLTAVRWTVL
jgi:hypothetical protein